MSNTPVQRSSSKASVSYEEARPFIAKHYETHGKLPGAGKVRAHFGMGSVGTHLEYVRRFESEMSKDATAAPGTNDLFKATLLQSASLLQSQHDQECLVLKTANAELRTRIGHLEEQRAELAALLDEAEAERTELLLRLSFGSAGGKGNAVANGSAGEATDTAPLRHEVAEKLSTAGSELKPPLDEAVIASAAKKTVAVMREDAAEAAAHAADKAVTESPKETVPPRPAATASSSPDKRIARSGASANAVPPVSPTVASAEKPSVPSTSDNAPAVRAAPPPVMQQGAPGGTSSPQGDTAGTIRKAD